MKHPFLLQCDQIRGLHISREGNSYCECTMRVFTQMHTQKETVDVRVCYASRRSEIFEQKLDYLISKIDFLYERIKNIDPEIQHISGILTDKKIQGKILD